MHTSAARAAALRASFGGGIPPPPPRVRPGIVSIGRCLDACDGTGARGVAEAASDGPLAPALLEPRTRPGREKGSSDLFAHLEQRPPITTDD